jgi:hemolysin activation/secretion protein
VPVLKFSARSSGGRRAARSLVLSLALLTGVVAPGGAQDAGSSAATASAQPTDGPAYPVSELQITYIDPNPQFPAPEVMTQVEVELTRTADGFVRPRVADGVTRLRLADLPSLGTVNLYESGLRAINQQLVFEFNERDFHAIVVSPLPEDIDRRTGRDLRPAGQTRLRLGIYAGRVKDVHTQASTVEGASPEEKIDRPEHAWIRDGSPLKPEAPNDLVRKDKLDAYLARLNRNPTRRVDAEIRAAGPRLPGGVVLDYFVAETKPWWTYAVADDTGTKQTNKYRQRFGAVYNGALKRDDVVQLDYITGGFDEVNAVAGSYEIPLDGEGRFRARLFGTWSDYSASVQAVLGDSTFSSSQYDIGGQLIANAFQYDELFLDVIAGLQYEHIDVESSQAVGGYQADEAFALALLGVRADRNGQVSTLRSEITFLYNISGIAGTDGGSLFELGRMRVNEDDFKLLRWNADVSFFLAPVFSPRSWRDPKVFAAKSLAHEVAVGFRGQHAFDRLIPQQEYVAGGLYTVRGYPESATAGDRVQNIALEYRLHVPRLLSPDLRPVRLPGVGNFHARPKYEFTFPDWDFIVRGFVDYAHVDFINRFSTETEEHLLGAGVGVELSFKRFVTARVDYGFAIEEVDLGNNERVDSGDGELHFSFTLLF